MLEIGQKLKKIREEHQISLEEISLKTSVRVQFLSLIEDGNFNELPAIYGKSFFKTYCQYLEIPEDEYMPFYEQMDNKASVRAKNKDYFTTKSINTKDRNQTVLDKIGDYVFTILSQYFNYKPKKFSTNYNQNRIVYTFAIILFCIITSFYIFFDSEPDSTVTNEENSGGLSPDTLTLSTEDKGIFDYFTKTDSLILEAYSIDTCWIKLNIDGKENKEVLALPKMKFRWSAKDYFLLTQGNVGAIQFSKNGKLLEPFGARGSVVKNVKITRENK